MPEYLEEQPAEPINWEKYWHAALRRRWFFVVPLFLGWLCVWSASWFMPSVYRSNTLILVERPTVPQQYVTPNVAGDLQQRLQSITQQILSRTRLLRIIQTLNLYQESHHRSPDEQVERMRKDIQIELVRAPDRDELTAFNIYFSSHDPHVAQQVTSELTNLFITENVEVRQEQSENTTEFLESQLEAARRTLSEQEQKIRDFKDQHLGELPGQLQSNLQILQGLQNQLQAEQDALNGAKQQNVYLESLLGQYRSLQRTGKTESGVPSGLPAIDQELERLRAQLADLSAHYTDRHPDVRKLKEQIAKTERMKQQIATQLQQQSSAPATQDSTVATQEQLESKPGTPMLELESQLKVNRLEIANRERSIEELKSRIGEYQARLNREPVREQELADLSRGYEQSRANYDELLKKKNDSELATNLERRQQGEHFRILDPPSFPVKPYSPNRLKLSGLGIFIGLALGLVAAVGAELFDGRIYSDKEIRKLVPVAVLADIPRIALSSEEAHTRKANLAAWVATAASLCCILAGTAFSYFRG